MQLEVLKGRGGPNVGGTVAVLTGGLGIVVDEISVARDPLVLVDVADGLPAGEVLAVEERPGSGPMLGHGPIERGRLHAGESRAVGVAAHLRANKFACGARGELPVDGRIRAGLFDRHDQFARLQVGVCDGVPGAAARLHATFDVTVVIGEFEPLWIRGAGSGSDGEIPAAKEGLCVLRDERGRGESEGEKGREQRGRFHGMSVSPLSAGTLKGTRLPGDHTRRVVRRGDDG